MTARPAPLLGGVDRAALAAALGDRLRAAGVPVTPTTALAAFAEALGAAPPAAARPRCTGRRGSPWSSRQHDLEPFDRVFDGGRSATRCSPVDPHAAAPGRAPPPSRTDDVLVPVPATVRRARADGAGAARGTRCRASRPRRTTSADDARSCPSCCRARWRGSPTRPFDELDARAARRARPLARAGRARGGRPAAAVATRAGRRGRPVALRATIAASRRTGWEPMRAPALPTRCAAR